MTGDKLKTANPLLVLLGEFPRYRSYLSLLVALGTIGALTEAVGISLVMLLLSLLLARDGTMAWDIGGFLGRVYEAADTAVGGSTMVLGGIVLGLVIAASITNFIYALVTSWLRNALSEEVRGQLQSDYFELPYERIRKRDTGELFNILSADSWAVADGAFTMTRIVTNVLAIVVFGVIICLISWRLALVAAAGGYLIVYLLGQFNHRAARLGDVAVESNVALTDRMLAGMTGMRAIRAYGDEATERRRFHAVSRRAREAFMAIDRLGAAMAPISEIGHLLLLAAVASAAGPLQTDITAAVTVVLLLYRLQPHIRELESNRLALAGHNASLRKVMTILDPSERHYPEKGTIPFTKLKTCIEFAEVSFSYHASEHAAVERLRFSILPRGITAITGPSGAGKTTIINLLLRLYEPTAGAIMVDGIKLSELRRSDWLSKVALAGQDADLIAGTIADNILLGDRNATRELVVQAARSAGIDTFIVGLAKGYDTAVGDRGVNLSGGQRQRIGLARALLRKPEILILDEATSAIDEGLEREIMAHILDGLGDRTVILITHRQTSLQKADRVIELPAYSKCLRGLNTRMILKPKF